MSNKFQIKVASTERIETNLIAYMIPPCFMVHVMSNEIHTQQENEKKLRMNRK